MATESRAAIHRMLRDSPLRCDRCGLWSTNRPSRVGLASPAGAANGVCPASRGVLDRIHECSGLEKPIQIAPQATARPTDAHGERTGDRKNGILDARARLRRAACGAPLSSCFKNTMPVGNFLDFSHPSRFFKKVVCNGFLEI